MSAQRKPAPEFFDYSTLVESSRLIDSDFDSLFEPALPFEAPRSEDSENA